MHVVLTIGGVMRAGVVVCALLVSVYAAQAAPVYDGSAPMQCAIKSVMVCDDPSICVRGTAQTVSLPSVLSLRRSSQSTSDDAWSVPTPLAAPSRSRRWAAEQGA